MSYLDDLSEIWGAVKESFRDRFAQSTIDMMFGDMTVSAFENNTVTFSITSEFKHMVVNEKYIDMIEEGFSIFLGFRPTVKVIFTGVPTNPKKVMNQILGREESREESVTLQAEDISQKKEAEDGRPAGITNLNTPLRTSSSATPTSLLTPLVLPLLNALLLTIIPSLSTVPADWVRPT